MNSEFEAEQAEYDRRKAFSWVVEHGEAGSLQDMAALISGVVGGIIVGGLVHASDYIYQTAVNHIAENAVHYSGTAEFASGLGAAVITSAGVYTKIRNYAVKHLGKSGYDKVK